jgi:hypothetical protein
MGANAVSAEILIFNRAMTLPRGQLGFDDLAMDHVDTGACDCASAEKSVGESREANTGIAGSMPAKSDNAEDAD